MVTVDVARVQATAMVGVAQGTGDRDMMAGMIVKVMPLVLEISIN